VTEPTKRKDPIQGQIIHVYDGIEEADNDLPRWWLYSLYAAIFFAAGYWFYYHEFEIGPLPLDQYTAEVSAAADSSGEVTAELLAALASSSDEVERGRGLFGEHCAVCHGDSGQGNIGPNLTDDRWLHGGAAMSIHTTIRDGVGAKGMPAWGPTLGPSSVRSLAVFVASIRDTNVPGKEPQGEVWTGEAAPSAAEEATADPAAGEAVHTDLEP
jgi:cytochrome c oxidase cbb3-type subunit 3